MKKISILLSLVFFLLIAGSVSASPLRLEYSVTDLGGGLFDYEFDLILDNNDGSWAFGQGWGWLIFGDDPSESPLADFIGDESDLPAGPWGEYGFSSGGGHYGPTLGTDGSFWRPSSVGEALSWSGTSTADLDQGELLFTTLWAPSWNRGFDIAYRVSAAPVPEPATMLLLGSGLVGLASLRRKFKR